MAEGQELGPKASYLYTTDTGTQFVILRDNDLSMPELTGLILYTSGFPVADNLPRRFRPRGVYWMGYIGTRLIRKFIICGALNSDLYASDGSQALTIGGVAGVTTSRFGEQYQFIRRGAAVVAP